ncbi:MAG: phosphotransferase, partial [Dissulfurimicrobium sp.]
EDLGDIHLQDEVKRLSDVGDWQGVERLYERVLSILAAMGVRGRDGFDASWCFDVPSYNGEFAFKKEVLYFLDSFITTMMGIRRSAVLEAELKVFSVAVDDMPRNFLIHRDFQSRNLMICRSSIGVIDFQGARFGPLGYDAASLLFDPYVSLPLPLVWGLFDRYTRTLADLGVFFNPRKLRHDFKTLAIFRLMQALGAYAFLGVTKGKGIFLDYIPAAISNLDALLHDEEFNGLRGLKTVVKDIRRGFL